MNRIFKVRVIASKHGKYDQETMVRIMNFAKRYPYLELILLILYYQFARPSEIQNLKVNDIDFRNNKITFHQSKGIRNSLKVHSIHPEVRKALLKLDLNGKYLFPDNRRKKDGCREQWKQLKKKLDLPEGSTMYSFKHSGVCGLYRVTKDIYLVSRLCGHSSIKTTEIYLRSLGEDTEYLDNSQVPVIG